MGSLYDDYVDRLVSDLYGFCKALGLKEKRGGDVSTGLVDVTIEVETNAVDRRMFATVTDAKSFASSPISDCRMGKLVVTDVDKNTLDTIDFMPNIKGDWNECI